MSNTNGQSPFLSVFMYLGEDKEYTKEVAMITEEFFKQRILGMKNEKGVYVTQAFPKLLYVLEPQTINKDGKDTFLIQAVLHGTHVSKTYTADDMTNYEDYDLLDNCYPTNVYSSR